MFGYNQGADDYLFRGSRVTFNNRCIQTTVYMRSMVV